VEIDDWDVVDDTDRLGSRMVSRTVRSTGVGQRPTTLITTVSSWTEALSGDSGQRGKKVQRSTRGKLIGDSARRSKQTSSVSDRKGTGPSAAVAQGEKGGKRDHGEAPEG
jgi:hypothetical protein